jgi:hypothetical protein
MIKDIADRLYNGLQARDRVSSCNVKGFQVWRRLGGLVRWRKSTTLLEGQPIRPSKPTCVQVQIRVVLESLSIFTSGLAKLDYYATTDPHRNDDGLEKASVAAAATSRCAEGLRI